MAKFQHNAQIGTRPVLVGSTVLLLFQKSDFAGFLPQLKIFYTSLLCTILQHIAPCKFSGKPKELESNNPTSSMMDRLISSRIPGSSFQACCLASSLAHAAAKVFDATSEATDLKILEGKRDQTGSNGREHAVVICVTKGVPNTTFLSCCWRGERSERIQMHSNALMTMMNDDGDENRRDEMMSLNLRYKCSFPT